MLYIVLSLLRVCFIDRNLSHSIPYPCFVPPPSLSPLVNGLLFILWICFYFVIYIHLIFRFHIWVIIDGETVADLILGASKITADSNCSHEIKRCLLLGRKVITNLDSIFKSRDITLPTKVRLVKAMVYQWSCMDMKVGLWRKLSAKELMLLNCGVGEDSWESLGLQGDPTSPF